MPKPSLDKKQQIVAVLLICVLGVLGWQVYSAFFSSPSVPQAPVAPATPKVVDSAVPVPAKASPTSPASAATSSMNASAAPQTFDMDPYQAKYLQLMEEYKIVELQKMIAADKQMIAAAQASTEESLNKINQLGGQANQVFADLPSSNMVASSKNGASDDLSLVYTGLQDGNWTATLKLGSSSYDVNVGSVINGKYKVTSIDNNGVVLQTKDTVWHISFDGLTSTPMEAKITPAKEQVQEGVTQIPPLPQATATESPVNPPAKKTPEKKSVELAAKAVPAAQVALPATASAVDGLAKKTPETKPFELGVKPSSAPQNASSAVQLTPAMKTSEKAESKSQKVSSEVLEKTKMLESSFSDFSKETHWYSGAWSKVKHFVGQLMPKKNIEDQGIPSIQLQPRTQVQEEAKVKQTMMSPLAGATNNVAAPTNPTAPVATSVPAPEVAAPPKTEAPLPQAEKTLAQLNASSFTIQASVLATEAQVTTFIKDYQLTQPYFVYQDKNKRYHVIVGNYPTRDEANTALASFKKLKKSGAYVISVSDAQKRAQVG